MNRKLPSSEVAGIRGLALMLGLFAATASAAPVWPPALSVARQWEAPEDLLIGTVDLGADGTQELLVRSSSWRDLFVLRRDASSARGYSVAARLPGPELIQRVNLFDVDADGAPELFVSMPNQQLWVYDGATLRARAIMPPGATGFAVGDVDGDGQAELIVREGTYFRWFDPQTFAYLGFISGPAGGGSIRIGNITGDARDEIVIGEGFALEVTDRPPSGSMATVWTSTTGALGGFALDDVDGDNKGEIASWSRFGGIGVHRVTTTPGYTQIASPDEIHDVWSGDVDGDGGLDLVAAVSGDLDGFIAIDLSGAELWRRERSFDTTPSTIGIADFGGTGNLSLVWNAFDQLRAEPLEGASPAWQVIHSEQTQSAAVLRSPGEPTWLATLSNGPASGSVVEFWHGGSLEDVGGSGSDWLTPPLPLPLSADVSGFAPAFHEDRPGEALALVGGVFANGGNPAAAGARIWIMDRSAALVRSLTFATNEFFSSAQRFPVPDESQAHLAVVAWSDFDIDVIRVIGLGDAQGQWQSTPVPRAYPLFEPLLVEDLDGDGDFEIALVAGGDARIFDPSAGTAPIATFPSVSGVAAYRPTSTGPARLLLSRAGGTVDIHEGVAPVPVDSIALGHDTSSMAAFIEPDSGRAMLASLASTNTIMIHDIDSGSLITSRTVVGSFLPSSRLHAEDIDGDGTMEIVATGTEQIVFRLDLASVFEDGFEVDSVPVALE